MISAVKKKKKKKKKEGYVCVKIHYFKVGNGTCVQVFTFGMGYCI